MVKMIKQFQRVLLLPQSSTIYYHSSATKLLETTTLVTIALIVSITVPFIAGELCWSYRDSQERCKDLVMEVSTRSNCCSLRSASFAVTPNLSDDDLFYSHYLKHGAINCQPCHTNCSTVTCPKGQKCLMAPIGNEVDPNNKLIPECVCDPECTQTMIESGPVCGSDLKTYASICELRNENCGKGENVQIDYTGVCRSSCEEISCPIHKYCIHDQNKLPHCINCSKLCSSSEINLFHEVCGTDNITYSSLCSIKFAKCISNANIEISYDGPCRAYADCHSIKCPIGNVCLRDAYSPSGYKCMDCSQRCLRSGVTICGTDLKTYADWCDMKDESCQLGYLIRTFHPGSCLIDRKSIEKKEKH